MPTHRWDEDSVAEVLQALLPEEAIRRKCLSFFADSINDAYVCAADRWGVTLKPNLLRLNVGKIEVFTIVADVVHCLVDLDTIPNELREREDICCNIPAEVLKEVLPLVQRTHRILIENTARTGRNPMTKKAHSPNVIDYLSSYLGCEIPQPTY